MIDEGVGMEREGQMAGMASPPMNVFEEGDTLVVETALPGLKAEDVEVTVENGKLTIRGETASKEERTERNYILREHRWRTFKRSVLLPAAIDADGAHASFEHGVLRIAFPRSERSKRRRIAIEGKHTQGVSSNAMTTEVQPPPAESDGEPTKELSTSGTSSAM